MDEIREFQDFYKLEDTAKPGRTGTGRIGHPVYRYRHLQQFLLFYLEILPIGHIRRSGCSSCVSSACILTRYSDRYIDDFKAKIIGPIITYIYPSAVYKPIRALFPRKNGQQSLPPLHAFRWRRLPGNDCTTTSRFIARRLNPWAEDAGEIRSKGCSFPPDQQFVQQGHHLWAKGHSQLSSSIADERYRLFPMPHAALAYRARNI